MVKKCTKNVCCTCKVNFLLIRPIVVFYRSPALPSPRSITQFYTLFEQTISIIESFDLALVKSLHYRGLELFHRPPKLNLKDVE